MNDMAIKMMKSYLKEIFVRCEKCHGRIDKVISAELVDIKDPRSWQKLNAVVECTFCDIKMDVKANCKVVGPPVV